MQLKTALEMMEQSKGSQDRETLMYPCSLYVFSVFPLLHSKALSYGILGIQKWVRLWDAMYETKKQGTNNCNSPYNGIV